MIGRTNAGGGGTGATLTVNAPAGVSVIATNSTTGRIYTRTANSSGVAVFKGLPTGTYLVHITDGTTTSKDFTATVVTDYDLTVRFFAAYINVTYPSGSTCTCSDGVTTLTATTTTGSYQFVVPNTGTWTVNCTNDTQSTSANVSITADEQTESVTLSYFAATISITYPATSNCVVKNSSGETVASDSNTGSSTKTWTATVQAAGTYTVTATSTSDSSKTKSQSVSITYSGQVASIECEYKLYLYNRGDRCTSITNDWELVNVGGMVLTWNADNFTALTNGYHNRECNVYTKQYINSGNYTKLRILYTTVSAEGTIAAGTIKLGFTTSPSTYNPASYISYMLLTKGTDLTGSLDISSPINAYVSLNVDMTSIKVYAIWLE